MNIGIVCYASVGGSGIVATELGKALAARGHEVHMHQHRPAVPARRVPGRAVVPPRRDADLSAVSRAAVPAVARQQDRPGRARVRARHRPRALRRAARDGRLSGAADSRPRRRGGRGAARHHDAARHRHHAGRQRSVVLGDRRVLDRAVRRRHRGVGEPAERHVSRRSACKRDIRVIPNFLDCARLPPPAASGRCARGFAAGDDATKLVDPRLELPAGEARRRGRRGLRADRAAGAGAAAAGRRRPGSASSAARPGARARHRRRASTSLGEQDQVVPLLSVADVFLLPSAQESFGLAALEAMACEVPVVASRVGGLPRGHRARRHRVPARARRSRGHGRSGVHLLSDPELHAAVAAAGRRVVAEKFCADLIVPRYEAFYTELIGEVRA